MTLPSQPTAVRVKTWRALKALGCAVLRDGAYLLPAGPARSEALDAIGDDIAAAGGSAHLLALDARDDAQQAAFAALFDRSAEYARFTEGVREIAGNIDAHEVVSLARALKRLRKDYEAIAAIDFFPGAAHDQARAALDDLESKTRRVLAPGEPHAAAGTVPRLDVADYQGRVWATRARPWVDRLASAWLVRRFIDRKARFVWLARPKDCPKRALGFDFDGAAFTHVGARVTFEVLTASFGFDHDAALQRIGAIVHVLDIGGIAVPEATGIEAVLRGLRDDIEDDDRLLSQAAKIFDAVYAAFRNAQESDA